MNNSIASVYSRPRLMWSREISFFFWPHKGADPNNRINLLVVLWGKWNFTDPFNWDWLNGVYCSGIYSYEFTIRDDNQIDHFHRCCVAEKQREAKQGYWSDGGNRKIVVWSRNHLVQDLERLKPFLTSSSLQQCYVNQFWFKLGIAFNLIDFFL